MEPPSPFRVAVPEETLADLRDRLARTRFIDDFPGGDGWDYGVSRSYLQELCDYWRTTFDWRAQEAILNSFDQFELRVDGQPIHFIHQRSSNPDALPLLLVHGWPGSIFEFVKVIGPLSAPAAYGADEADAFHVVAPSIPGYGFSGPTVEPGWGPKRIAAAFADVMTTLGYERYGAAGGDWGAIITTQLARVGPGPAPLRTASHVARTVSRRTTVPRRSSARPTAGVSRTGPPTRPAGRSCTCRSTARARTPSPTRLNDSPAGLAAWLLDKYRSYSDCGGDVERSFTKDELLAQITTYWVTGTIASASRLVLRARRRTVRTCPPRPRVEVPTGCAIFPRDVKRAPRPWAEREYNIQRWVEMPRGGHFPGVEAPELLSAELREFFRLLRA